MQRLLTDGSLPVVHQFVAAQVRPFLDQCSGSSRELTIEYLARRDRDLCFVLALLGAEVRRWMVVEVHRDDDPVEGGDPRHTDQRTDGVLRPPAATSRSSWQAGSWSYRSRCRSGAADTLC
jgi:hypothetical protein